jgi:hypothetical protein
MKKKMKKKMKWYKSQFAWIGSYEKIDEEKEQSLCTKLIEMQPDLAAEESIKEVLSKRDIPQSIYQSLGAFLLTLGGKKVCIGFTDGLFDDSGMILDSQHVKHTKTVMDSKCHANSAKYWKENPDKYYIMSGYALSSDDGMWRHHSWLLDKQQQTVVETTSIVRDKYYGFFLSAEMAEDFYQVEFVGL